MDHLLPVPDALIRPRAQSAFVAGIVARVLLLDRLGSVPLHFGDQVERAAARQAYDGHRAAP